MTRNDEATPWLRSNSLSGTEKSLGDSHGDGIGKLADATSSRGR